MTKLTVTAARKKKLTIAFTTSEAGTATVRLLRETKGRRKGKTCVAKRTTGTRCTIRKAYGSVKATVTKAGAVTVKVNGKVGSRALAAGAVRIEVTVVDKAGNTSAVAAKRATVRR